MVAILEAGLTMATARPVKVRAWVCRGCGRSLGTIRHQRGQQTRYTPDAAAVALLWWQGRRLQFRCRNPGCGREFGQLVYEVEAQEDSHGTSH